MFRASVDESTAGPDVAFSKGELRTAEGSAGTSRPFVHGHCARPLLPLSTLACFSKLFFFFSSFSVSCLTELEAARYAEFVTGIIDFPFVAADCSFFSLSPRARELTYKQFSGFFFLSFFAGKFEHCRSGALFLERLCAFRIFR